MRIATAGQAQPGSCRRLERQGVRGPPAIHSLSPPGGRSAARRRAVRRDPELIATWLERYVRHLYSGHTISYSARYLEMQLRIGSALGFRRLQASSPSWHHARP